MTTRRQEEHLWVARHLELHLRYGSTIQKRKALEGQTVTIGGDAPRDTNGLNDLPDEFVGPLLAILADDDDSHIASRAAARLRELPGDIELNRSFEDEFYSGYGHMWMIGIADKWDEYQGPVELEELLAEHDLGVRVRCIKRVRDTNWEERTKFVRRIRDEPDNPHAKDFAAWIKTLKSDEAWEEALEKGKQVQPAARAAAYRAEKQSEHDSLQREWEQNYGWREQQDEFVCKYHIIRNFSLDFHKLAGRLDHIDHRHLSAIIRSHMDYERIVTAGGRDYDSQDTVRQKSWVRLMVDSVQYADLTRGMLRIQLCSDGLEKGSGDWIDFTNSEGELYRTLWNPERVERERDFGFVYVYSFLAHDKSAEEPTDTPRFVQVLTRYLTNGLALASDYAEMCGWNVSATSSYFAVDIDKLDMSNEAQSKHHCTFSKDGADKDFAIVVFESEEAEKELHYLAHTTEEIQSNIEDRIKAAFSMKNPRTKYIIPLGVRDVRDALDPFPAWAQEQYYSV